MRRVASAIGLLFLTLAPGCRHDDGSAAVAPKAGAVPTVPRSPEALASVPQAHAESSATLSSPFSPQKVDLVEPAMGTEVHFVAYTTKTIDEPTIREAMRRAHAEIGATPARLGRST